jgi:hypothetical protein
MTTIEKKAWPELFEKVRTGKKTFDLRLEDFKCKPGDTLFLREWTPKKEIYTGRALKRKVTFVFRSREILKFWSEEEIDKYGFQVIGFSNEKRRGHK